MPRRKAASASAGAPVKRKKKGANADVSEVKIQWEWEADGDKWTIFNTKDADELPATSGEYYQIRTDTQLTEIDLTVGKGDKVTIQLERNIQKNTKTGWERRIRPALMRKGETEFCVWEWEDDHKRWVPYAVDAAVTLEMAAEEGKDETELSVPGVGDYTVDLKNQTQTKDDTGFQRKIRRVLSEAVEATESAASKPASRKAAKKNEEEEAPSQPTAASKSKGKAKSSGKKGKSGGGASNVVDEEDTVKTVVVKGAAPVDPECTAKLGTAHVFVEGKDIYDVMLNQTNVQNNNNKFFVIQLLEDDNNKRYSVWFRWGRVGFKGQNNLVPCASDLDEAKKVFCKKFADKTKNDWADRKSFTKVAGKYDLLEMDYGAENNGSSKKENASASPGEDSVDAGAVAVPDSTLDDRLQELIRLICDVKSMEDAVIEMKYDAKKAPLGKLTSQQIKAGYAALKIIDDCVDKGTFGKNHLQACNDFYTRIPHYFGMRTPPLIRTKEEVKLKLNLLEALDDIEVAMKILKRSSSTENPVDTQYKGLDIDLDPLDSGDADYKMIEDYVKNTHATTHSHYTMKVVDVFACNKEKEATNYNDVGNRMLLWHGSRLTNWVGILNQGLRIAPPEAPVTGYMFGKGVYFADMSSKSANYCFATRTKNTGLLLLCEVALGNMNELLNADYTADKLPAGKHSVWGKGRVAPDPKKTFTTSDGMTVPIGKPVNTKVANPHGYTLNYNEFIVYSVKQIRMKYLVKVNFNFK